MWRSNTKTLRNRHIVAIDDTPSVLTFLRVSLEALGAQFQEALTASGGLSLCEQVKPDVVVLDLGLPDQEGMNILSRLKRIDKGSNLPIVIVLTVRSEAKFREQAMELGADAYVTKPFRMEDLIDLIHSKLEITTGEPPISLVTPPMRAN